MPLEIYNTLGRKKEVFVPLDPEGKRVTIYNCGPTIYDHFHVGNARNFVVMDIVRRYFEWLGYEVKFVQNLTDIDDKIIQRANDEHISTEKVTETYARAYYEDSEKLGIRRADEHPRATDYVEQMVEFMKRLETKGLAYAAGGSLYFRVRKIADYGKLSGQSLDDMRAGERVDVNPEKEDPMDFVLWKASKPGEPVWQSPWGEGRPGWHSECCVMARKLLGETIDIHAGGTDLTFPHHENEIAQHEGLYGVPLARYWMHNGFLNINREKMSKSLGNFFKIDEVFAQGYEPETVRFFLLSAAYRHPLDYNDKALDEARSSVARINDGIETGIKILEIEGLEPSVSDSDTDDPVVRLYFDRFEAVMDDDFNTQRALAVLHEIITAIHEERQAEKPDGAKLASLVGAAIKLRDFFGIAPMATEDCASEAGETGAVTIVPGSVEQSLLGLLGEVDRIAREKGVDAILDLIAAEVSAGNRELVAAQAESGNWTTENGASPKDTMMKVLIAARGAARKEKAFDIADAIRDGLSAAGIILEDHTQGTIWRES